MKKLTIVIVILLSFSVSGLVIAEPYAPKVKITSSTPPVAQMFIKNSKVPDSSKIHIPAYPGAKVLQTYPKGWTKTSDGKLYLPYVKLLSSDSVDKVVAWYKKKLPSYFFQKKGFFGVYTYRFWKVKGDYGMMDMDAMGTIENVGISDGSPHADAYPDVVSMIEIAYKPK